MGTIKRPRESLSFAKKTYKIDVIRPIAAKLKNFVLYKTRNTLLNNLHLSAYLNNRKLKIERGYVY